MPWRPGRTSCWSRPAPLVLATCSPPSKYGASHANVVSMSWGGGEFSGETAYDTYFAHAGVAFVASSGDDGAPAEWPAASPNVLSVGGTALTLGAGNVWSSEVGWSGSGGGTSAYESQPSYQKGVVTQTSTARATPDVAYDASPSTGVCVYDSVPFEGGSGWWEVGGTSAGAPQWSALLAIADQGRALSGQSALNSTSPQQVMSILYDNPTDFHDITSGTSTGTPNYSASPGYDYVTGLGSPIANLIVGSLDGTSTASYDKLVLAAPTNLVASASAVSSTQINLTWTGSNGATGYLIQQSLNGSTGWTQVGSSTSTTFQQTGLSAATTYYFRVLATLGTIDSAYSNVASATTRGTAATPDSIWGNSSVPSENYYSHGSYELGVKFTASVAGEVTGVRFYKQTWMGRYVHVGHLWSSTGTLLATATFTNESAYGWQQVNFSSPVAITANTVYIASFSTGGGYFGITSSFFTNGGVTTGPLQALSNSVAGGDGVYNRAGTFPDVGRQRDELLGRCRFHPIILRQHYREGLFPGLALDRSGWVRFQGFDQRSIQSFLHLGAGDHTGGAGAPRRRIAWDNAHCRELIVVSPSYHAGRDARVLAQEAVVGIGLNLGKSLRGNWRGSPCPRQSFHLAAFPRSSFVIDRQRIRLMPLLLEWGWKAFADCVVPCVTGRTRERD